MEARLVAGIALDALAHNKMRSALTMLGVIIGVGAVIAMVGVGQGAENQVQQQIKSFGTNTVFVSAGSPAARPGGVRMGSWNTKTLTIDDLHAIQNEIPLIQSCAPGTMSVGQVVFRNQNWNTRLMGTTAEYFTVRDWPLMEGTMFDDDEVRSAQNVAVLGKTVSDLLFTQTDPVGQTIRIQQYPFRVIGVLAAKGQSPFGDDQDDRIFVPYTTLQKKLSGRNWLQFVSCSAVSQDASASASTQIEGLLRERHRIGPGMDPDFQVSTQSDIAQLAQQTSSVMTLLLASIASISLLVGGIGIMNIMLVSVTERTREIGIRMAVGATGGDIERQFLAEAVTLSLLGGAAGIALGAGAVQVVGSSLGWPVLVSVKAIVVAALFAGAVGVFFGYYPARKAARLNPIEALRYE